MRTGARRAKRRRPTRTFVSLTGPAGNLGDALLRREQLAWAQGTSDELVLYTGEAPDSWLRQLGVPTGARVLRSKRSVARWLWLIATAPSRPVLVFEAGEVPLDRGNVLRELVFLAETVAVRLKRGVVVRPPRGIRAPTEPASWLHARAAQASQIALWRDAASAAIAGVGRIAPDIGFAAGVRSGRATGRAQRADREPARRAIHARRRMDARRCAPRPPPRGSASAPSCRCAKTSCAPASWPMHSVACSNRGATETLWHRRPCCAIVTRPRGSWCPTGCTCSSSPLSAGPCPVELVPRPTGKIAMAFAAVGLHRISLDASTVDAGRYAAVPARATGSQRGGARADARRRAAAGRARVRGAGGDPGGSRMSATRDGTGPQRILFLAHSSAFGPFRVGSHHYARVLARRGAEVVHLSTPLSFAHRVTGRVSRAAAAAAPRGPHRDADGVTHIVPRTALPVPYGRFRARRELLRHGIRPPFDVVLIDQPLLWDDSVRALSSRLVYRPTDLYPSGLKERRQRDIMAAADGVVATSAEVLRGLGTLDIPAYVLENGVDAARFSPPEAATVPRPAVCVYVGSLDGRFDWQRLNAWARASSGRALRRGGAGRGGARGRSGQRRAARCRAL